MQSLEHHLGLLRVALQFRLCVLESAAGGYIACTPLGCTVSLVDDGTGADFGSFVGLDPLGLDTVTFEDAASLQTLADWTNFEGSQLIVWYTGARDITVGEADMLEDWLLDGGGLIVTGPDALSNSSCFASTSLGDDDDSAAGDDDDSAAGDDDDSAAGDDDDSAAGDDDDCDGEEAVSGWLLADLIRSLTVGDGPQTDQCAISDSSTPVVNGPFGNYTTSYAFTASGSNHESVVPDAANGAVRVATVGGKAKLLYTEVLGGGSVLYWNGNEGLTEWDSAFNPDLQALLLNTAYELSYGCGAPLQGGDCDDSDATLYPGTCP